MVHAYDLERNAVNFDLSTDRVERGEQLVHNVAADKAYVAAVLLFLDADVAALIDPDRVDIDHIVGNAAQDEILQRFYLILDLDPPAYLGRSVLHIARVLPYLRAVFDLYALVLFLFV